MQRGLLVRKLLPTLTIDQREGELTVFLAFSPDITHLYGGSSSSGAYLTTFFVEVLEANKASHDEDGVEDQGGTYIGPNGRRIGEL